LDVKDANVILTFQSYFEEVPTFGSEAGRSRIRKCQIFFFVEDNTIQIVEKPQVNSGIPQGTLVKRAVIPKADGSIVTVQDLVLGEYLVVYGRNFQLLDCDSATRLYLQKVGVDTAGATTAPSDQFSESIKKSEEWGRFHSKRNPNKQFMEASLGNTVNNSGREGFTKFGNIALKFLCIWDNTDVLYGDRLYFSLNYYLSDNTIEICSVKSGDSGSAPSVRLLKRSRLPKVTVVKPLGSEPEQDFYHWKDFHIGMSLDVYCRSLRIVDCDEQTKKYYDYVNVPLGAPEPPPALKALIHEREIPPPTAFGSEEDSLRSCQGSLMPGPAPAKKLGEDRKLSFFGMFDEPGPDDADRRFVVTYFVQDGTVKIQEPPRRNSGFSGGVFLSRRAVKTESGEPLTYLHLYVGAKVQVLRHTFVLFDANESTFRWMEDKKLPRANFYDIVDKIRPVVIRDAQHGILTAAFARQETDAPNRANKEALTAVLTPYGLLEPHGPVSSHEILTIVRANGNKLATFDYTKLIEQIISPTDEFK